MNYAEGMKMPNDKYKNLIVDIIQEILLFRDEVYKSENNHYNEDYVDGMESIVTIIVDELNAFDVEERALINKIR